MAGIRIGDDRREAIDWLQDRLGSTRPVAETTMIAMLREGHAVTTNGGIMLAETEEEFERQARAKAGQPMSNWARIHFRNHNRSSKSRTSNQRTSKRITKTDWTSEADQMIFSPTPSPDRD